jgi:WD40 repeat protein
MASAKDGTSRVWEVSNALITGANSGELLLTFSEHIPFSASWSPDGTRIATSDQNNEFGSAKIWDAATGEVMLDLFPEDFDFGVSAVAWSPDGTRIVTFSADGLGRIWDAMTGEELMVFTGVSSAAGPVIEWSPSGNRILTAGEGGEVKVWDANTGRELLNLPFRGFSISASWSPGGDHIAVSDYDGNLRIYPVWQSTQELVDYAKDCCVIRELTPEERQQFGLPPQP